MSDDPDRRDIVLLALTRPTLKWGVPLEGLILNASGTVFGGMIFSSPAHWYRAPFFLWLACVPIHFVMRRIVAWDMHGFRAIRLFLMTTGTGRVHLANLPRQAPRNAKDIPGSV